MAQTSTDLDSLRRFDLNLLVALEVLIAERSVTAASRRMGVGQPAMSNALSRLRDMFGDPLLIRTPAGLQPTSRALDLAAPVARILAELREEAFSIRAFSPATDRRTFRIGLGSSSICVVWFKLCDHQALIFVRTRPQAGLRQVVLMPDSLR